MKVGSVIDIGGRIQLGGAPDMAAVGNAVHRFLAADQAEWIPSKRREMAERLLRRWSVTGLGPEQLLLMSDRLRRYIQNAWPKANVHREVPIHLRFGDRIMNARIDLLLQHNDEFIVIDHKTFPGGHEQWQDLAQKHAAQVALYADAVCRVTGAQLSGMFLHLPIVGQFVRIERLA